MRRPPVACPPVERSAFAGFRFPPGVITVAARWYLRYGLSYRDVEELLAERGIQVDHITVYRWAQRFTPLFADAARPSRHATGDRWFVDETYVKVAGRWRYLYRAWTSTARIGSDHGRLKARLRPMRGLKRLRSAARIAAGHAFVQNLAAATTNRPPTCHPRSAWRRHSASSRWL